MSADQKARQTERESVPCWACGEPATVRYIAWDEPEAPAPRYCDACSEKFPPVMGVGRLTL